MPAPSDISEIQWSWGPGQSVLALLAGGRIVELAIERPDRLLGTVCLGRVSAVDRSLDAAFIQLGLGETPGFLPGAKARGLNDGQSLVVRVIAEARAGKGPKLSTDPGGCPASILEAAASARIPSPLWRPHVLETLLAAHPGARRVVVNDAAALAEARRFFPDAAQAPLSDLDEAVEAALNPVVALPSGGRLVIESTAALTAIDVDSGAGRPADANREAVAEIARQSRLRGLGGQIVVDFVSGPKGTPYRMAAALKKAVAADPTPTHVFGVSPLGLVEMSRERRGIPLADVLCRRSLVASADSLALTALRRVLAEAGLRPAARLGLVLAPEVFAALARQGEALAETERRLGRPLALRQDAARDRDDIVIEDART
ncbi:ribonuclease E/G [Magnetospirillum sp. SS-4]|uniref:ribonuclease E/G n=1 Tax=Magnetospirillum sp. SS-4 TaxID=2681465 RepID=UPI001383D1B3|nr:ribonuclease E/G [Magnetospirillum sp. SS-4]CAA7627534.1 Ribonuclease G and E [Magnetospirillum sp. SS-4]